MDSTQHRQVLDQILDPRPENAAELLSELGLSGLPSREQVHREIEEKLLLPREKLPVHWLPTYQV